MSFERRLAKHLTCLIWRALQSFEKARCSVRATLLSVRDECVARVKIVRFLILEKIAA